MKRTGDYNGWTNWDTWNTALMMDNDQESYNESRRIVERYDYDPGKGEWALRDWAIEAIIGPTNAMALQDAQEWNDVPEHERLDPHYEDLQERNPQAADLVNQLGFGPDVSDYTPDLIDPELVNWSEIYEGILEELREDGTIEYEDEDPDAPGDLTLPEGWTAKVAADDWGDWEPAEGALDAQAMHRRPFYIIPQTGQPWIGEPGSFHPRDMPPNVVLGEVDDASRPPSVRFYNLDPYTQQAQQLTQLIRQQLQGYGRQAGWQRADDDFSDQNEAFESHDCDICGAKGTVRLKAGPTFRAKVCSECGSASVEPINGGPIDSRDVFGAEGWWTPEMTNLNQGVEIPGKAPGMPRNMETFQDSNSEPCPHCGRPNVPIYVTVCPECGMRIRPGFEIASGWEGAPAAQPGWKDDNSNNWLYLHGKVAFGDSFWTMANKLAEELGMTEEDTRFIENMVARNHLPESWDVAYGEITQGVPRIWASTIDRNHVWDVVKEAQGEHARV